MNVSTVVVMKDKVEDANEKQKMFVSKRICGEDDESVKVRSKV